MGDLTVIYYTSNREDEHFEQKIRTALLSAIGSLPLISVSQKPMDFGENICVGDVGVSNQNAHRQFQIGAKAAKTPFVASAEADCLYPSNYFTFRPPSLVRAYRTPIWVLHERGPFYKKPFSECATIVGRDYIIAKIDIELAGRDIWRKDIEHGWEVPFTFRNRNWRMFRCGPIVSLKTGRGMHKRHQTTGEMIGELPGWGTAQEVRKHYVTD